MHVKSPSCPHRFGNQYRRQEFLIFEGDSRISKREIPLEPIVCVRHVNVGEFPRKDPYFKSPMVGAHIRDTRYERTSCFSGHATSLTAGVDAVLD